MSAENGHPEAEVKSDEAEDTTVDAKKESAKLMMNQFALQSPGVLAALQNKLTQMVGVSSGYIESLPAPVKRRIKALKCLQYSAVKAECEFYREVHELECKYADRYRDLYERRAKIVNGDYEPADPECDWPTDDEDEEETEGEEAKKKKTVETNGEAEKKDEDAGDNNKKKSDEEATAAEEADVKGIPEFWLTILKNSEMTATLVQEHDEPILANLRDIQIEYSRDPMGFKLLFYFAPNDYFSNPVLTKEYAMKCEPEEGNAAFDFEGPEIVSSKGCVIDWKSPEKNVTVKTVKKKQKHKGRPGQTRTVTREVKEDSFFNFFATLPQSGESAAEEGEGEDRDDELEDLLSQDYEVGHYIRETVIPRAVLCFTGEIRDEDEDSDEEYEEGEDEEDEDPDYEPPAGDAAGAGGAAKPDCKQQ